MLRVKSTTKVAGLGLISFVALWLATFIRIDFATIANANIDQLWQSLGVEALSSDLIASLGVLHTQPPGLNLIYALDLWISPESHLALAGMYFLFTAVTIWMIADVLLRVGLPRKWAGAGALLYSLLPATVLYSLWPFTTTACAFFSILAVWGVSILQSHRVTGVTVSTLGALALVLTRASFTLPFLLVWLGSLAFIVLRSDKARSAIASVAVIVAVGIAGIALQIHYSVAFGIPTMSSWSGENLAKALTYSGARTITPEAIQRVNTDPCALEMINAWQAGKLRMWNPAEFDALPACAKLPTPALKGVASWDEPLKVGSTSENFNDARRLMISKEWSSIVTAVVRERPSQLLKMALSSGTGPRESSLGVFLSPAEDYPGVTAIRDKLVSAQPLGVLSLLIAPAMLFLMCLGLALTLFGRAKGLRGNPVFWFIYGISAYQIFVSVLFEYGENMRFQAEIEPVLIVGGFIGIWAASLRDDDENGAAGPVTKG